MNLSIRNRRHRSDRRSLRERARFRRAAASPASRSMARRGSSLKSSSMRTTRPRGTPHPDLTFELFDPNGDSIQFVDSTTNPESLILELPLTGTYTVDVGSFQPAQSGDFLFRVQEVEVVEQVLSDYNLLFFLQRRLRFRDRRTEPVHEPPAGARFAPRARRWRWSLRGPTRPTATIERRGPDSLRGIQRRESAGVLQLP